MVLRLFITKFDVVSQEPPGANLNLKHIFSHAQNRPLFAPLLTSENCLCRRSEHLKFGPLRLPLLHLLAHLADDPLVHLAGFV